MGLFDLFKRKKTMGLSNKELMGLAREMGASGHNGYWEGFKIRTPELAEAIEQVCGRNMSSISDGDAFQIVATFSRWSENTKTPIDKLRVNFEKQIQSFLNAGATYDMFLEKCRGEKSKEAKTFNISEDFTIANFMYEWTLSMKEKDECNSLTEHIARKMSVPDIDSFKADLEKSAGELNLAPDISKLDREENRLFALAQDGAKMFEEFNPHPFDDETASQLTNEGKIEALILCSTMVMELHSNFKNELDMDVQTDRYFLLLADTIMGETPDDEIGFINSRIAFYNKERRDWSKMGPLDAFKPDNAISHIYNALFVSPFSEHPEITPQGLPVHDLVMFRSHFEKVQKAMSQGCKRIKGQTSGAEDELREEALKTLNCVFPPAMRADMTKDMAWLFSGHVLDMVKTKEIDEQVVGVMPSHIKAQVRVLVELCKQSSMSDDEISDILDDAQNEFVKAFRQ